MEIIVCVKRVPDTSEVEVEVDRSGLAIEEADLTYGINEWDNFAVEAAVQLKETHGGKVTAFTVGGEEDEEVLRRALAMGADEALHLCDPSFEGCDAAGAAPLKALDRLPVRGVKVHQEQFSVVLDRADVSPAGPAGGGGSTGRNECDPGHRHQSSEQASILHGK